MNLLKFGRGNAKLNKRIATFALPSGWTCPGALHCMAKADRVTGKVTDGNAQNFRCFQVSTEAYSKQLRDMVWHNLDLLKGKSQKEMRELILASLPVADIVRIHVGGDFFSAAYFRAWADVARARPAVRFYAYTKSIHLWLRYATEVPANMVLTASEGGRYDDRIGNLKRATVVFSPEQAAALNLELDHDDSHAYDGSESFALLLHGTQQKGTVAAKALSALKHQGLTGYGKK